MDHSARIVRIQGALVLRRHLDCAGAGERALREQLRVGNLIRVSRGAYLPGELWNELRAEQRLLARTIAIQRLATQTSIFSHHSAAAIWGLPMYALGPDERVHLLTSRERRVQSTVPVMRHVGPWGDDDLDIVEGLRVTRLTRTLIDMARSAPAEMGIGCLDSGLRMMFVGDRRAAGDGVAEWKGSALRTLRASSRGSGPRHASKLIVLADPRADAVSESASRLQLHRLRVPFEIQVRVTGLSRGNRWMDFEFLGQNTFGEVDGMAKYTDERYRRAGENADQVVAREKRRDDEVYGVTRKGTVHWGYWDGSDALRLGKLLMRFGIRVPGLK